MSETLEALTHDRRPKTPWHIWTVGIIATLWNAGGVLDYVMTQTRNESYLGSFSPEQPDYFFNFPIWANIAWAFGVWGAFIGSLLILLRSRYAVAAFIISLLGLIGSTIYQMTADMPSSLNTPGIWAFNALIWTSVIFLIWYSSKMTGKGILR
ncbi:hypothetical protein AB1K62_05005 [Parasphingorhabdus sp. JC815]|uniref:hypothetical protein n=1 Tax=Parasphingorhabdus sp. JC815 TaxID=3232140 RepID=UPI003457F607